MQKLQIDLRKCVSNLKNSRVLSQRDLNSRNNDFKMSISSPKNPYSNLSKSHKKENSSNKNTSKMKNNAIQNENISNFNSYNSETSKKTYKLSNKENCLPIKKNEMQEISYENENQNYQVIKRDYTPINSEEIELIEENADLYCGEKIQDIKSNGLQKEKIMTVMPNIMEETDEEMSNNCSPNKTEFITNILHQKKMESYKHYLKYIKL